MLPSFILFPNYPTKLPILVAADLAPIHTLPNSTGIHHVELKQGISVSMADVGGRSSSVSAAEENISAAGSKEVPLRILGVDTIEVFLPHMHIICHVFPCASCK